MEDAPKILHEPIPGDPSTPLRSTQDDINVIEILKGLPFGRYTTSVDVILNVRRNKVR